MSGPDDLPKEWIYGDTLNAADVARVFNVNAGTVTKWAKAGMIGFFRTPNGNRVFPEAEVERVMRGHPVPEHVRSYAEWDNKEYSRKWAAGWRRGSDKEYGTFGSVKSEAESDDE